MINIQRLIEEARETGYTGDYATAKVCQDIILKALASGPMSRNVTIKGGVVMRCKTNNVRRATRDLDIDFIRYSLADESIDAFITQLNCIDGVAITRSGKREEFKQQDYSGRRVIVHIEDAEGHRIQSKIDLGVHNRFELEPEEYCFDVACDDEGAVLLINSAEQMFAEKLRSLLKFGPLSARYKDVYDMYYLMNNIDRDKLISALNVYIFHDNSMREKEAKDIVKRLRFTFHDKIYINNLDKSATRWIDDKIEVITGKLLTFLSEF